MYTVAITTSSLYDYGSDFISRYSYSKDYSIVCIINKNSKPRNKKKLIKKIFRIGIFGTAIGVYLRKYYKEPHVNIIDVCKQKNIPYYEIINFDPGKYRDDFIL